MPKRAPSARALRLAASAALAVVCLATLPVAPQHATAAGARTTAAHTAAAHTAAAPRPHQPRNVVLITTDDQTLTDLRRMPRTRRLIMGNGVALTGISPHPLCCPARAEILTGQFAQNNGVRSNAGKYGGLKRLDTSRTIATWMNRAGYHTIFMGKYLNGYKRWNARRASRGWDDWNATVAGVYHYNDFTVSHGLQAKHYHRYQTDYFTDLAVRKLTAASKTRRPFFLWQSYMAPHNACPPSKETSWCWVPPVSAPRHRQMFSQALPPAMHSKAFNEADTSDKPFPANQWARLTPRAKRTIIATHRNRLRSLQAVDQGIAQTVRVLRRTHELNNTLIIFASDNGYLLGEHRFMGKVVPYEPALRIPLLMRGPGIPQGVVRDRIGTLVDIAPTIIAATGARPTRKMDGRSLLPVARRNARSWKTLLIQAGPYYKRDEPFGWFYRGVRTGRYTYAHYPLRNEDELYDRFKDPDQLDNLAGDPRYADILAELKRRKRILSGCSGQQCRQSFGLLPRPLLGPSQPVPPASSAASTAPSGSH